MPQTFVEVLLDQNLAKPLDYSVPEELQGRLQIGMRVEVPVRGRLSKGTIASFKESSLFAEVKAIVRLLSKEAELSNPLWKLAEWMSHYYFTPLQRVLKCFIPPNIRKEVKAKQQIEITLNQTHAECLRACEELRTKKPKQAEVLEAVLNGKVFLADLMKQLGITRAPVDALVKKKLLKATSVIAADDLLMDEEFFPTKPKLLNEEQQQCVSAIVDSLKQNWFSAHLIFGITGSGKTEVYMRAIAAALEQNKSAIMLVPEISLTSQTIERFKARFHQKIAILHHRRSLGERTTAWDQLKKGEAMIVIGARSAVFSPAQNLGLIIVDEEHDSSYKQSDEQPCYQGRDIAVKRAHLENCVVLLGSATPSIESRSNAEVGKYQLHHLNARATAASLPSVKIIDMKRAMDIAGGFTHFSGELLDAMKERLKEGEQTLLFLNKRGYHRMQLCKACRYVVKCPHCDLSLTFHKAAGVLRCHLCDWSQQAPRQCPSCKCPESLEFKGFGTEHVERSLHAIFPEVRTLRMDRDTTGKKEACDELFKQFRAHKADVLIGTQMIAKGFHFPSVTLVGVLNMDATLSIPDFRSPEQAFQILTQVAGRAGRSQLPGEVIIQTFLPNHPIIHLAAKQDYPAFYKAELEERRTFGYPPFCHLVKILFSGPDEAAVRNAAEKGYMALQNGLPTSAQLLPVTAAGHGKIKDQYRFQFVIKALKVSDLRDSLAKLKETRPINVKIDVDPLSTFF